MTRDEIERRILEVAAQVFKTTPDALSLDSSPETLKAWDSFAHVALTAGTEQAFGLELPPHESAFFENLADFAAAYAKRLCATERTG